MKKGTTWEGYSLVCDTISITSILSITHVPVSTHLGPAVFGETSPKFVEANAATKGPLPGRFSFPFKYFSMRYEAYPLLSPHISCAR
jgi:hypothetical protein